MIAYNGDKYGRTIWINPKGEIIDISLGFGEVGIHFNWIKDRYESLFNSEIKDKNDPEIKPMIEGWIKIRNHENNFYVEGVKEHIKKNGRTIFKILDEKVMKGESFITQIDLFNFENDSHWVDCNWYDIPDQESHLKKYGIKQ